MKKLTKEMALYLIFGVLTTLVNFIAYVAALRISHVTAAVASSVAWLVAVLFAYAVNRRYVFGCEGSLMGFFGARICSGLMEIALMASLVDVLRLHPLLTKIAVGVAVTVMNYLASRYFVFRRPDGAMFARRGRFGLGHRMAFARRGGAGACGGSEAET